MKKSNFKFRVSSFNAAFSLIELLMVLVIVGIISAIVIPNFVQSMKGNRLRTATRTVVKAGRYARSMAVLRQVPITLNFDLDKNVISVAGGEGRDNIVRELDRVVIESVKTIDGDESDEKTRSIIYHTNGRCQPYVITLSDGDGAISEIEVDALASVVTDTEDE